MKGCAIALTGGDRLEEVVETDVRLSCDEEYENVDDNGEFERDDSAEETGEGVLRP